MRFAVQFWLWLVPLLPLLWLLMRAADRRAGRRLATLLGPRAADHVEMANPRLTAWRRFFLFFGLFWLLLALARPLRIQKLATVRAIRRQADRRLLAGPQTGAVGQIQEREIGRRERQADLGRVHGKGHAEPRARRDELPDVRALLAPLAGRAGRVGAQVERDVGLGRALFPAPAQRVLAAAEQTGQVCGLDDAEHPKSDVQVQPLVPGLVGVVGVGPHLLVNLPVLRHPGLKAW